jgi:hypothetical protein
LLKWQKSALKSPGIYRKVTPKLNNDQILRMTENYQKITYKIHISVTSSSSSGFILSRVLVTKDAGLDW